MRSKIIKSICGALLLCSSFLEAYPFADCKPKQKEEPEKRPSYVYLGAYGGYGVLEGMHGSDGQTAQGRFSLGVNLYEKKWFHLAFEAAVQNGNEGRLKIANGSTLTAIGSLYPQATLKMFPDFLFVMRFDFYKDLFLLFKGGFAYRQFILTDRISTQDSLHRINGEFQAGFGYQLSDQVRLIALYQGIYSMGGADLRFTSSNDVLLGQIPTQQAGWIGIDYSL